MVNDMRKPKLIKGMTIEYDDKIYKNIISVSRGYDYSSFSFLDDGGAECSMYLAQGKSLKIVQDD